MFNFLKGKQDNLNVTLDRPSGIYFPGESVTAAISFECNKEVKVQEGRAVLICEEEFDYRSWDTTTDSDGNTEQTLCEHRYSQRYEFDPQVFLLDTTLTAGTTHHFSFSTQLPQAALPSTPGKIIKVRWLVKATLDRKLAADYNTETEFTIPATLTAASAPGQYGQSSEMDQANLSLELPSTAWLAGETINGTLHIHPLKNFDVTGVRLELVRKESVSYDQGLEKEEIIKIKLGDKMRLQAGQPMSLPFKINMPTPCPPSGATDNWTLSWVLRGVLARFLRKDTLVEKVIVIYTGKRG